MISRYLRLVQTVSVVLVFMGSINYSNEICHTTYHYICDRNQQKSMYNSKDAYFLSKTVICYV